VSAPPSVAKALVKRAIDRFGVVIIVVIAVFLLVRVLPHFIYGEDPLLLYLKGQALPGEPVDAMLEEYKKLYGIGEPFFPDQFFKYLRSLFMFDLGYSLIRRRTVVEEFAERLPNTLALNLAATTLIYIIGFVLGWYTVTKRGKSLETAVLGISVWSWIMPGWLMCLIFIIALAYLPRVLWDLTLFPMPPYTPPRLPLVDLGFVRIPVITPEYVWYLTLPVIALVVAGFGSLVYYTRQLTITELGQDYVLTAKAKGLKDMTILSKHVFRNVIPPVLTILGFTIPGMFVGGVITETILSFYGMGILLYEALLQSDYPVLTAWFFIYTLIYSASLYIVDVLLIKVDPRVRLR